MLFGVREGGGGRLGIHSPFLGPVVVVIVGLGFPFRDVTPNDGGNGVLLPSALPATNIV